MKTRLPEQKFIAPEDIEHKVAQLRQEKKTIATLNGSFDLMHAGHLYIIFEASKQADILIVALNSDSSIQRYKSKNRPIISLQYRLLMMAALSCVDYVTWFDETDPRSILTKIKPDVHVNGIEYGKDCIEAETVRAHGGTLFLAEHIPGLSTSEIIKKIKNLCD
jgi:rfaE bifunctional protein nucleotidyltransferase chain/domain